MDDGAALDAAQDAASAWGALATPPRLVLNRENAVFEVRLTTGWHGALRLHRAGYQTPETIRSELLWIECLADAGFACPWPLRTLNDDLIHAAQEGPVASMLQWITAEPIGPAQGSKGRALDAQAALYRDLGALLADFHLTADAVGPETFSRPAWDRAALLDPSAPRWGRYWEHPLLSAEEAGMLCAARDAAWDRLDSLDDANMGLIHGDVLQENVLRADKQLYLIDFDDCGIGYRQYDLATALIQHENTAAFEPLAAALWDGYHGAGGPLPAGAQQDLPFFVMLRAFASAGWVMDRVAPDDPRQSAYAMRAVRWARRFLDR